ncbi:MAG: hypothetical protein JW798_16535 [Prolixibacteraceae bacterium]|nr:hypothetical protein [Prolixibacteraceae bacterium]
MIKKIYLFVLLFLSGLVWVNGQLPGSYAYDFRDGTIVTDGQSSDEKLTLAGSYSYHSTNYGLNMKVDGVITLTVSGSSTVRFLGSKYSGLNMVGSAVADGDLGTQSTKVEADLVDYYDFVYGGNEANLTFKTTAGSGNDLYLPLIEVIPAQLGGEAALAEENIVYRFDLRDGSIIPNETTLNGNYVIEAGLFKVEPGSSNAYGYNGAIHGSVLKTGNKITLQVAGNSFIKVGGCQYSNGTISVSSATGSFDQVSQASQTASCYHEGGATIDFLYVGTEGAVVLDFTGTTYIPVIEVIPVPYDVSLESWVQKSGTVSINNTDVNYTAGATSSDNPTITVSDGTVISATTEKASVRIDLAGNSLSSYTPVCSGDIESVNIDGDRMELVFSDAATNPKTYIVEVADNSVVAQAEPGKTYIYNFADGSVLPQTSYSALRYVTFVSTDGILTLNSNTSTQALQFGYHDSSHGAVLFPGNSMDIIVAGNATFTLGTCQYGSATDAVFEFTDESGTVLGSTDAHNIGSGSCGTNSFNYTGPAGVITATLKSAGFPNAEVYIHGITIENAAEIIPSDGKTDVWDFGAEQLNTEQYNNKLNEDVINTWYDETIVVGSNGNVLPGFSAGTLSFVGGGNDRLRTTNTSLTRYDENIASVSGYTGRIYVNSTAATGRYLSLTLSEDDEVTIIAKTDAGGNLVFQNVADPVAQTDEIPITSNLTELNFVAKSAGTYHVFDNLGKPSYYRIYRKDATYVTLTGLVDVTQAAGIPDGYQIVFENEAGKTWTSFVTDGTYSVTLPAGYSYSLALTGANGYIIRNATSLEVIETTISHDVTIAKVELYTVSGAISGLGTAISNLQLVYAADEAASTIYHPEPEVDAVLSTYSVQLEPGVEYTILAQGVNDYYLPVNTLTIGNADQTADLEFSEKVRHHVSITTSGLSTEQEADLGLVFTNLYEEGYQYSFESYNEVSLRDGVYVVDDSGLDAYPVELELTSNLYVDGAEVSKNLEFRPVTNWSFDDQVISAATPAYKGLLFTGTISNEISKGHLVAKPGATVQVPVNPGHKIRISYYYSADFTIEGGEAITTSSGSTSVIESIEYIYSGSTAGYVTLTIGSGSATTYLTQIEVAAVVDYQPVIYVGPDKTYTTINDALSAVREMVRANGQRVTILIDPGNYEEMLVIDVPEVMLKNASATPSIGLQNSGVGIDAEAVRITSYYGHGYNYYSMGSDQKWNADVLRVNKENGYPSYDNVGAGTTNGSYWNATVVVSAPGFEADHIIFENSFNQYISQKESEDVVVMWTTGSKGLRPVDYGNTAVQDKSFVERAAAIAITNNTDKVILNKCRVVGRQDSFFGGSNTRVVVYKGTMMGSTDYLFGGMTAVFYQSDLLMNTSDNSSDVSYITAAQQSSGRGYLMYECTIGSASPGNETASLLTSKPGYFGRPWQATTSEVVFYNTLVKTSDYTGFVGKSLINPIGWLNTLGGESNKMYEYGTIEESGENNLGSRANWSTVLSVPTLTDGTAITTFNFTRGTDGWDPIPALMDGDVETALFEHESSSLIHIYAVDHRIFVSNIHDDTRINVYSISGILQKSLEADSDINFGMTKGLWIVEVISATNRQSVKVSVY